MILKDELIKILESGEAYVFDQELVNLIDEYKESEQYPFLYRYSPADYYNIRMLETKSIYLAPIGKLNDAFEGVCSEFRKNEYLDSRFDEVAYVKCFSEKHDNLVMWGQYADAYAGMCVEYDVNRLIGTEYEHVLYHLFPVIYTEKRFADKKLKYTIDDYRQYFEEVDSKEGLQQSYDFLFDILHMFLKKNKAWELEQEWLMVVTSPQLKMSYDDFDDNELDKKMLSQINDQVVLFDCIKTIYIGPRMNIHVKQHIQEIGRKIGVSVIEMHLSETEYKLIP